MKWKDIFCEVFDVLRFPLVVMVVFLHLKGEPHDMQIDWIHFSYFDCYNLLRIYVSCIISNIAVPLFFLMSGYLFFHNVADMTVGLYLKKIFRRTKTLCIPYLFWVTIFLIGNVVMIIRSPDCIIVFDSIFGSLNKLGVL